MPSTHETAHGGVGLLGDHGLRNVGQVFWNLPTPALYEEVARHREGAIAHLGPVVVRTGQHTGRSPNDRFIVGEPSIKDEIWWGHVNRPFDLDAFERLRNRQLAYLQGKDLFVQDCYAGADPTYRVAIRVITETAWHSLFARNMLIRELDAEKLGSFSPGFTVLHTPHFQAIAEVDGTNSEAFIIISFAQKLVIIGGTNYAGEIKKSVFSIMNYLLPYQQVLPMHSSVNYGRDRNDVAIFFGLSGTGKTTLSTASDRTLIGDDEHGWSADGVFNFEGGCYAKVINLSAESEPEIHETTRRFGTILENVGVDMDSRRLDLDDASLTENTRAAYPISHIPHADRSGMAGQPRNIIFLTYDAFGVLPPISRLTAEEATFHFICGYTSKVAGTEAGIKEPQATFSPCFGAPFMPLAPKVYAGLLGEKIKEHKVDCWLVNTGLTGGPYGTGHRMPIAQTRAMVRAALDGRLSSAPTEPSQLFRLSIPRECPDVPPDILDPRKAWKKTEQYDEKARELASRFTATFKKYGGD